MKTDEIRMIFISLGKFRKKMTKELAAASDKYVSAAEKSGGKVLGWYYTLGRYDSVLIYEVPDKVGVEGAMKGAMAFSDYVAGETLVAIKREDAVKLLD